MDKSYLFSKDHVWICIESDMAKIGISDYAQEKLGGIMFINLPEKGEVLEIGEKFGDVESIKIVSDLISPVAGKVININEDIIDNPEDINLEPYKNWLAEISVDKIADNLMDEQAYLRYKEEL